MKAWRQGAAFAVVTLVVLTGMGAAPPAPAVSAQPDAPLRAVSYDVSIQTHDEELIRGRTGVGVARELATDGGSVEIDIMTVAQDLLGVRVIETMRSRGYAAVFQGNVGPQDGVHFAAESINDASYVMLLFFGMRFASDQSLAVGSAWTSAAGIRYTVRSVQSPRVTLDVLQRSNVSSASTIIVHGTVVYDPSLLVPISGDVIRRRIDMTQTGPLENEEELRFARHADTFDRPVAAPPASASTPGLAR
ncbi:MAG: hypothetical protein JO219_01040 [Candidatus Eremiobacteraeota bacterium]|nr:hypothetical protein [Candidatus Eremiobacteraeota bacterium]MBV8365693.1 hypothetical protein [Candidatus Eremiobacteraeota bacterium]